MKTSGWLSNSFSFSKLSTFARCPRKAWYRYVLNRKEAGADFFMVGRAAHKGQEIDNKAKLRGERLSVPQVLEAAVVALKEECAKSEIRVPVDAFAEEHRKQLEAYEASGERSRVNPAPGTVEAMFRIGLEVAPNEESPKEACAVEGFVDVVSVDERTGERTVVDYKTAGRAISDASTDAHLQLGFYATGAGAQAGKIVSFVKGGRQKPTTKVSATMPNTEARWQRVLGWFAETIAAFKRCLKTGDWPKCAPECHWCSRSACSFYGMCYPEKDPNLAKLVQVTKIEPAGTLPEPDWRK